MLIRTSTKQFLQMGCRLRDFIFREVAWLVNESGMAVILMNKKPRYVVVILQNTKRWAAHLQVTIPYVDAKRDIANSQEDVRSV